MFTQCDQAGVCVYVCVCVCVDWVEHEACSAAQHGGAFTHTVLIMSPELKLSVSLSAGTVCSLIKL